MLEQNSRYVDNMRVKLYPLNDICCVLIKFHRMLFITVHLPVSPVSGIVFVTIMQQAIRIPVVNKRQVTWSTIGYLRFLKF